MSYFEQERLSCNPFPCMATGSELYRATLMAHPEADATGSARCIARVTGLGHPKPDGAIPDIDVAVQRTQQRAPVRACEAMKAKAETGRAINDCDISESDLFGSDSEGEEE